MAKTLELPVREKGVCCPPTPPLRPEKVEGAVGVLKALADPTRLQIALVLRGAEQPLCICDFTAAFDLSQPTVSHHMAKLRDAGLVESTRVGIWTYYALRRDLPHATKRILDSI